jgi:Uma2 family endonuclease
MSEQASRLMTADEFLAWQAGQDELYEFVDGQPSAMAGAKIRHDRITTNAMTALRAGLRSAGSPCDVFSADIAIRTGSSRFRRPDASVLCPPFDEEATSSDRPRLVLEVLSEGTESVDRLVKVGEYQALPGLDTILIVDPRRIEIGFWFRDAAGTWRAEVVRDVSAMIELPRLGVSLAVAALYERVPIQQDAGPRLVWRDTPSANTGGKIA